MKDLRIKDEQIDQKEKYIMKRETDLQSWADKYVLLKSDLEKKSSEYKILRDDYDLMAKQLRKSQDDVLNLTQKLQQSKNELKTFDELRKTLANQLKINNKSSISSKTNLTVNDVILKEDNAAAGGLILQDSKDVEKREGLEEGTSVKALITGSTQAGHETVKSQDVDGRDALIDGQSEAAVKAGLESAANKNQTKIEIEEKINNRYANVEANSEEKSYVEAPAPEVEEENAVNDADSAFHKANDNVVIE